MLLCVNNNTKQVHTGQLTTKDREILIISKIRLTGLKEEKKPNNLQNTGEFKHLFEKKTEKIRQKEKQTCNKKINTNKKGTKAVQLSFLIC